MGKFDLQKEIFFEQHVTFSQTELSRMAIRLTKGEDACGSRYFYHYTSMENGSNHFMLLFCFPHFTLCKALEKRGCLWAKMILVNFLIAHSNGKWLMSTIVVVLLPPFNFCGNQLILDCETKCNEPVSTNMSSGSNYFIFPTPFPTRVSFT